MITFVIEVSTHDYYVKLGNQNEETRFIYLYSLFISDLYLVYVYKYLILL